jgi:ATPase family associated with various cellular activities (AAA)
MQKGSLDASWTEANQAYLVSEFARLKRVLGSEVGEQPETAPEFMPPALPAPPAIDRLSEVFGLSTFERDVLLLCAGVEMDSQLEALCGMAEGRPQQAYVTFGLALAALREPHWSALTPGRPLRRFRLVEVGTAAGLTRAPVRVDERILHYLAGINALDPRLDSVVRMSAYPDWIAEEHQALAAQAVELLKIAGEQPPVFHLCGDDPLGQEDIACLASQSLERNLWILPIEELQAAGHDCDQLAVLWEREALLLPGALLIECGSAGLTPIARRLAERLAGPLFVASRDPIRLNRPMVRLDVDKPRPVAQQGLWEKALGPAADRCNGALDRLSGQFRLSAKTIVATSAVVRSQAREIAPDDLWNACRSLCRPRLEDLAERIVPAARWEDLVLPELERQTLGQLAAQVRHRVQVHETWGFSAGGRRGLGLSVLFTGESGTGKTLAAEVLACDLGLDLYRIDLSAVVSKYIGETEKNLKRVFDAAQEGGALLLFDEADALFGKRSDVRDSHDRYANIEVSYLLQRMEAYQGLAILTTNLKSSLDRAFLRRLRFTVNFPFPDPAMREAIWNRVFPARTPTDGLVPRKLAQLNVAGGNIRNIALNAAFFAADCHESVHMRHVLQAARLEAQKIERPLSEAEIRGWV